MQFNIGLVLSHEKALGCAWGLSREEEHSPGVAGTGLNTDEQALCGYSYHDVPLRRTKETVSPSSAKEKKAYGMNASSR